VIAALVGPFAEAVMATLQPCTFLLIVPTVAAVGAARAGWQALVAAVPAGIVGGWILVDNRWILDGWQLRASAALVAMLFALLVSARARALLPRVGPAMERAWPQAATVGVITLIATTWWRPCVGEQLGAILNEAQNGLAGQLAPMAAYMVGALIPLAGFVAMRYAWDPPGRVRTVVAWSSATVGFVVAVSLAAGQHDDVVVTLTRWTLE
jgi:hypothetical protein